MSVSIERARENVRHNYADTGRFDRFCRQSPAGGASEITTGDDNVALFHVSREIGIGRLQNIFRHLIDPPQHHVRRRDHVGGYVVTELPAVSLENQIRSHGLFLDVSFSTEKNLSRRWLGSQSGVPSTRQQKDQSGAGESKIDAKRHAVSVRAVEDVAGQQSPGARAEAEEHNKSPQHATDALGSEIFKDNQGWRAEDAAV